MLLDNSPKNETDLGLDMGLIFLLMSIFDMIKSSSESRNNKFPTEYLSFVFMNSIILGTTTYPHTFTKVVAAFSETCFSPCNFVHLH